MTQRRVQLADVALEAGVSKATASRVLTHTQRNVSPDLIDKVQQAALKLGYKPNHVARALRTGQNETIGLVVPTLSNPYFVAVANAFAKSAQAAGSDIVIADSRNDVATEALHCERLTAGKVDAIAIIPVAYAASAAAVSACFSRIPTVQIDRRTQREDVPAVVLDNEKGMRILMDCLSSLGYRSIIYVGAESESSSGFERIKAFQEIAPPQATTIEVPVFSTDAGRLAASLIEEHLEDTDAIICGADVLAVGIQSTLMRSGHVIPDDVALVSFDNSELLELVDPPITSLKQPLEEMTDQAIAVLVSEDHAGDSLIKVVPGLAIRDSSQVGGK